MFPIGPRDLPEAMTFCDQKIYQGAPNQDIVIYDCLGNSVIRIHPDGGMSRTNPATPIGIVPLVPIDPYYVAECENIEVVDIGSLIPK